MIKRFIIISLFLFNVIGLTAQDYKNQLLIKESAFPLIPAFSEIAYTRTKVNPFGLKKIDNSELEFWYMADSAYFAPNRFIEVGTSYKIHILEFHDFHLSTGIGTAISLSGESLIALSIPFIYKMDLDYFISDQLSFSSNHDFLLYGGGYIYETELPIAYSFYKNKIVILGGPGFAIGVDQTLDYSAWAFSANLSIAFRWGN